MADEEVGILIKIKNAAKSIAEIEGVKKAISGVGDLAKKSTKELNDLGNQGISTFAGVGRGISSLTSTISQYTRYAAVGAGAGLAFGLKTAGGLEQTNIAFKTLLGNQEAATEFTDKLQAFARSTPFNFTDVVGNAQQLLAQNFKPDEVLTALNAVGNAAAGLNKGQDGINRITLALGQMRQAGKVNATDLRQLTEVGVDGWGMLAEAAGVSTAKMMQLVSSGVVPGVQATNVIMAGLQKRYGGIMQEQSKTFMGQISNMVDTVKGNLYKVDADGKVSGTLGPLIQLLERNMPAVAKALTVVMTSLGRAVQFVVSGISEVARGFKNGGMDGAAKSLGNVLGVGDRLVPIWHHIRDDSLAIARIWQGSLWPAIQNVAAVLGPLVMGSFKTLEAILRWMADHPTVASIIFTTLGLALAEYAIVSTLFGVASAIRAVAAGFAAANLAVAAFPIGAAKTILGLGGAEAAAAAAPAAKLSYSEKTAQLLAKSAPAAPVVAEATAGTLALPVAAGLGATAWLGKNLHDTYSGINKHFSTYGRFAKGGSQSVSGPAIVGEEGIEIIPNLPGGSNVTSNRDLRKMLEGAGGGTTVVFGENSLVVNGADYLQVQRFADAMINEINNRIARS